MYTLDKFSRPLKDLRISVTDRCNFRCNYCMPKEVFNDAYKFLPMSKLLTFEEMERLVNIFASLGTEKIRITGGEPLMRKGVPSFIKKIRQIPGIKDVAITTNGIFLPKYAKELADAGLNRIAVSLDSMEESTFRKMNGDRGSVSEVINGIDAAEAAGIKNIKINCVVQKSVNLDSILDMARFGRERGFIIRFIEYMDVGNLNGWNFSEVVYAKEILDIIGKHYPLNPVAANYKGETAVRFLYADGKGEIGLINSISEPFCGTCSRIRLSSEGKLYTCLFATEGTDIISHLRNGENDEEIRDFVKNLWENRLDRYSAEREEIIKLNQINKKDKSNRKVEMYHIGG